ncbi:transcription factor bHLH123-like isoform X2 [Phragmites australis]|uniref:transcription factor bHLH123-like isoform X2 n=1 Tax=Phragmites australis TaxID=29695 RepID=UPI002D78037A|nr:transcription factor bHLH123-like isoform X2 [Phragmites australis]
MQWMAQEGSEASVASSPPPPPPPSASASTSSAAVSSWWRDMHPASYASWPPPPAVATRWPSLAATQHQHHGRTTSSGADDDLSASNATMTSFTNTSTNHSGLSMDSSVPEAAAVAAESHLWNQVLMGAGGEVGRSMQAVHDAHDDSENFLELLNSRTLAPELFAEPPACDYLKKMEYGSSHAGGGGWPDHHFTEAALEKHLRSGYGGALAHQHQHHHHHHAASAATPERLTANLSDLVSNWSIAPPNPCLADAQHLAGAGAPCDNAAVAAMGHGAKAGLFLDSGGVCKHEMGGHGAMLQEAGGGSSTGGQEFLRPNCLGYNSMLGLSSNRMYGAGAGAMDMAWGNNASAGRSLSDLVSFGGALGKPEPATGPTKTPAEYKKQGQEISSPATNSGGGSKGSSAASEGKKKRSEERQGSEGNAKKSKNEASSPTSSLKSQMPKVKLGDKITALQQIVSPFGKTDTASVLYEAINYIKWLHEQVQLLSDPYMKTSSSKEYNTWGGLDRKEKSETEIDLRSRGLCLVPVSCTPQMYRDNNGLDYWTPPYRSCLYR